MDAPNANTNKSPRSIPEGADKPVKYFIYSYYYLDHTSDSYKIGAMWFEQNKNLEPRSCNYAEKLW